MRPLHFARELLLLAAAFLLHAGETFAGVILTPEQLEAQPHKPGVVRFGFLKPMKAYGDNNYQPGEADIRRPLMEHLERTMPDVTFQFVEYHLPELYAAARSQRIDFGLMSAGHYVELRPYGAYALGTVFTSRFPDPNRFAGALFVTTDRHPEIRTIADMKGRRAVLNSKANFINYQIPMAAVADAGFDPDDFFKSEIITHDQPQLTVEKLLNGDADVSAFRICEYEALLEKWPELEGRLRPVAPAHENTRACLRSTSLFPGWTVARTSSLVEPAMTKRMVEALMSMPVDPKSSMGFSVATEFDRVDRVFKTLRIGPYAYLREWTLERIWQKYSAVVVTVVLLLLGGFVHLRIVERQAQARARELNEAYVRQREIESKAIETEERLRAMSRLGVVSQLSSIFAHEMGQPLSAIRYRTRAMQALLRLPELKKGMMEDCLRTIEEQSERAAGILQKVRAYAKGETSRLAPVRLDLLVEATIADLRQSGRIACPVEVSTVRAVVTGDELELGLAVLNILKNAAEAVGIDTDPGIAVAMQVSERSVVLEVRNRGAVVDPAEFQKHITGAPSSKTGGTGLGLIIIHSIAEAHGGSFAIRPLPEGGAQARLELPLEAKRDGIEGKKGDAL